MYSWFDIKAVFHPTKLANTEENFAKNFDQAELDESADKATALIAQEVNLLGSPKQVFIGGFSQGCAVALAAYLRHKGSSLGGVVGVGGFHAANINWR